VPRKLYAKRYAEAVFEIAQEKKELERWQSDLKKIASLGESAELIALLESPKLSFDDKSKMLSELLPDINPLAINLVHLLVTRGRFDIAGAIAEEYGQLLNSYRGIEQAEVTAAVPLTDKEKEKLKERLKAVVGKEIVLKAEVDPDIKGGIIIRVGGKLIDGSTRSKLQALRRELTGVKR